MAITRAPMRDILGIKRYAREDMLLNNRLLAGATSEFTVYNDGNNTEEHWYLSIEKTATPLQNIDKPLLCLEGEGAQYWVEDGYNFLGNLTGIHLTESQSDMLNLLIPKLPQHFLSLFQWEVAYEQALPEDIVTLAIHYGSNDVTLKTHVGTSKSQWLKLLKHPELKSRYQGSIPTGMSITAPIRLGSMTLGMQESRNLDVGDLVFLNKTTFTTDGYGIVPIGNVHLRTHLTNEEDQYYLTINSWEIKMNENHGSDHEFDDDELISDDMDFSLDDANQQDSDDEYDDEERYGDEEYAGEEEGSVPVADLPVKLEVRLGSIKFTVSDFNKLVEGKIYPIDSICPGQVQLMSNDMELARGQLVEVDGQLAVEIQKRWIQS